MLVLLLAVSEDESTADVDLAPGFSASHDAHFESLSSFLAMQVPHFHLPASNFLNRSPHPLAVVPPSFSSELEFSAPSFPRAGLSWGFGVIFGMASALLGGLFVAGDMSALAATLGFPGGENANLEKSSAGNGWTALRGV